MGLETSFSLRKWGLKRPPPYKKGGPEWGRHKFEFVRLLLTFERWTPAFA